MKPKTHSETRFPRKLRRIFGEPLSATSASTTEKCSGSKNLITTPFRAQWVQRHLRLLIATSTRRETHTLEIDFSKRAEITHLFHLDPHSKPRGTVKFLNILYILVSWRKIQFIQPGGVVTKILIRTLRNFRPNRMVKWRALVVALVGVVMWNFLFDFHYIINRFEVLVKYIRRVLSE